MKDLEATAVIRVESLAQDKILGYANNFIEAIEAYESTFQASGYYDPMVELVGVDDHQIIDQKEIIEAELTIMFHGQVAR